MVIGCESNRITKEHNMYLLVEHKDLKFKSN